MKKENLAYLTKWILLRTVYIKRGFIQLFDKLIYQKQSLSLLHYYNAHRSPFKAFIFFNSLGRVLFGTKQFIALLSSEKLFKKEILLDGFDKPVNYKELYSKGDHNYLFPKSPMVSIDKSNIDDLYFKKIETSYFLSIQKDNTDFDKTVEWERITKNFYEMFFDKDKKLIKENLINFQASSSQYNKLFNDQYKYLKKEDGYFKSYLKSIDLVLEYHRNAKVINKELLASISESKAGNNQCLHYRGKRLNEQILFLTLVADDIIKNIKFNDDQKNVILDIGASYGGLSRILDYYIPQSCHILLDLPESLILSAYYIKYNFPNKKIALLEDIIDKLDKFDEIIEEYDFIVIPPWVISMIMEESVDLVINTASFGFMSQEYLEYYFKHIDRVLKHKGYFYSLNKTQTDHWGIGMYEWNMKSEYVTISHQFNNRFAFPQWIGKKI
jgi:putative sugar O-methyltransferase